MFHKGSGNSKMKHAASYVQENQNFKKDVEVYISKYSSLNRIEFKC